MQDVRKDGSGGEIKGFDVEELKKSLTDPYIDHVEVFNIGSEAHERAIGRIKNLTVSRREKKRLKKILLAPKSKAKKR